MCVYFPPSPGSGPADSHEIAGPLYLLPNNLSITQKSLKKDKLNAGQKGHGERELGPQEGWEKKHKGRKKKIGPTNARNGEGGLSEKKEPQQVAVPEAIEKRSDKYHTTHPCTETETRSLFERNNARMDIWS